MFIRRHRSPFYGLWHLRHTFTLINCPITTNQGIVGNASHSMLISNLSVAQVKSIEIFIDTIKNQQGFRTIAGTVITETRTEFKIRKDVAFRSGMLFTAMAKN